MEIILHIGAHRTASTTFQGYMRANSARLETMGIGFWGPFRTRNGLFAGILPTPGPGSRERAYRVASGRISLACEKTARAGARQLIVSDENVLGAPRRNLRADLLYPEAGARVARHVRAFGRGIGRIVLSIRSPELYWASCFAFAVGRGHPVPDAARIAALAAATRTWRDVITDIATAAPGAEILVMTHEELAGRPERRLWHMTGRRLEPPQQNAREWLNRSPDLPALRRILHDRGQAPDAWLPQGEGRWMPFSPAQQAALRETYYDDLHWLKAGADGRALLVEDCATQTGAGTNPARQDRRRGRDNDEDVGRMVGHR